MTKKRFNNLSLYRIFATICILQFHVFYILYSRDIPFELMLSKGVQGLTALSGFLYSQKIIKDYKKFYLNNLLKLLIPAFLCIAFMAIWDLGTMFATQNWDYISLFFGPTYFGEDKTMIFQAANYYYLAYIVLCYLITPLLQRNDKWPLFISIIILIGELALAFFFGTAIIASTYIVGYFIGKKWYKHYVDTEIKYKPTILIQWILILLISIGLYIALVLFPMTNGYFLTQLNLLLQVIMLTIFGTVTFFLVAYAFRFLNRFNGIKFLMYTDSLSLIIYLMNQAFMVGGMDVSTWVNPMWAKILIVYLLTIVSCIVLEFINKLINKKIFSLPIFKK